MAEPALAADPAAPAAPPAAAPAAAAPAPAAAPPTALTATPDATPAAAPAAATPAEPAKGAWPEDWQSRMVGNDKDELKQVSRYQSPEDVWKKARELEKRLSSGQLKAPLAKDAKPEEVAQWRKDNGIPETPDKYDLGGLEVPESDKEIIGGFLKMAHGTNMTPAQAKIAVEAYYAEQNRQQQLRQAKDTEQQQSALDALNQEWGGNFRRNMNLIENVLSRFPESVRDSLKSARLPDGTAIFNVPDIARAFVSIELENNPAGVIAPAGGGDVQKSALGEYKDLQKLMHENRSEYNRDPAKQARMTELIDYLVKNEMIDGQGNEIVKQKKAA